MAKTNRISINFKLPEDLLEEARAFATENETTLTALVIEGLRCVLDSAPTDNGTDTHPHEQDLANLKDTVETLGACTSGACIVLFFFWFLNY